jgi:hypothetical protein
VCGRPLDANSRLEILRRSKLYLGQDEAGAVNALKRDIEAFSQDGPDAAAFALKESCARMLDAQRIAN